MFNLNYSIITPDQLKSVRENEANIFCFVLTLRPPGWVKVSESGIKW